MVPTIDETELGRVQQRQFTNVINNMTQFNDAQLQQMADEIANLRSAEDGNEIMPV
jgi:hypothetical protein